MDAARSVPAKHEPAIHILGNDEDGDVEVWLDVETGAYGTGLCIGCCPTTAEAIAEARRSLADASAQLDALEPQS